MNGLTAKSANAGLGWPGLTGEHGCVIVPSWDSIALRRVASDPLNMSQVSWVMQLFCAMHIRGNATRLLGMKRDDPAEPRDLHVWQYRAFCPDVTLEDHDQLRHDLVVPHKC
jgi:hypothetical protein